MCRYDTQQSAKQTFKSETLLQFANTGSSLLQQPGPKKFKLSKIEPIYKAKKFKVPPFTI